MTPTPEDKLDPADAKPDAASGPPEEEFAELGGLLTPKGVHSTGSFQALAGNPGTAVKSDRYICPVPDCPVDWYRTRVGQSPPLCEEHGQVLVPEAQQP